MRTLIAGLLVFSFAWQTWAQQPRAAEQEEQTTTGADQEVSIRQQDTAEDSEFSLHLDSLSFAEPSRFNPLVSMQFDSEEELKAALWDAPLGRVRYQLARQQAMIGREGLVGGGHMLGVGMASSVLGDGRAQGVELLLSGKTWSELSNKERFKASVQVTLWAGVLAAIANELD